MQTGKTFLDAGWDFVGETANGTEDIWKIGEGLSYPRLAWEKYSGGTGEPNDPYQIATAADLIALGERPEDYNQHFILTADIDLDPNLPGRKVFDKAAIAPDVNQTNENLDGTPFTGTFDGNDRTISHLTIDGKDFVGLFGVLDSGAQVKHLGVVGVHITGSRWCAGGLAGRNNARVTHCYCTGQVSSDSSVGGLVGYNYGGFVTHCYSTGSVSGAKQVGGMTGHNAGSVIQCYCNGAVDGNDWVGGLVGWNEGTVRYCYSTSAVSGEVEVGGLVGLDRGRLSTWGTALGCFWDIEMSGQATSAGGTGKTTAEMMDRNTFVAAGWDFVGLPDGPHDIWAQPEGGGYPILWWQ